jgi:hypothetical protein
MTRNCTFDTDLTKGQDVLDSNCGITLETEDVHMRRYIAVTLAVFAALSVSAILLAQSGFPVITKVDPAIAQRGDVVTVTGEYLDPLNVAALYLTDGQHDWMLTIVAQTPTSIKATIPAEARNGRFALMVRTKGDTPKLIEEPVRVTVQ